MKRWILLTASVVLLGGCLSLTETEKLAMSPLYQVTKAEYKDIRGDFTVDTFLLYKKVELGTNTAVTVDRWQKPGIPNGYSVGVHFIGSDWRFMSKVLLRTDRDLYELRDDSPYHQVYASRNAMVEEKVTVFLTEQICTDLRGTGTLRIQYFAEPVDIPPEGVAALRSFLE